MTQGLTPPNTSLYWDDFERRIEETVKCIKEGTNPPVRRVAVFITEQCNFKCKYCNHSFSSKHLSEKQFERVLLKYGKDAIIHITGGEPSVVKWLYPFLEKHGDKHRFHLNTNAYIKPPASSVKRLKISLDSHIAELWESVVGKRGAFEKVIKNIKLSTDKTLVSLTYTLNKSNYLDVVNFAKFVNKEFPNLYAIFFSVYKGDDPRYVMTGRESGIFFNIILPKLKKQLSPESLALINDSINEKKRLIQGIRFEQNLNTPCYLSMSERVISPLGEEFTCSHLYRDEIHNCKPTKHEKCLYGCNQRLVMFNDEVERRCNAKA